MMVSDERKGCAIKWSSNRATGECKTVMMKYLQCMKKFSGTNENECRFMAKDYLACRMDR